MMKQILLCVAAMFAKIGLRKRAKLLRRNRFVSREILLSQNALDPDIDWKSAPTFVGKKHDTIRDLRAHAWQCTELFSKIGIGKRRPRSRSAAPEPTSRAVASRFLARYP